MYKVTSADNFATLFKDQADTFSRMRPQFASTLRQAAEKNPQNNCTRVVNEPTGSRPSKVMLVYKAKLTPRIHSTPNDTILRHFPVYSHQTPFVNMS